LQILQTALHLLYDFYQLHLILFLFVEFSLLLCEDISKLAELLLQIALGLEPLVQLFVLVYKFHNLLLQLFVFVFTFAILGIYLLQLSAIYLIFKFFLQILEFDLQVLDGLIVVV